MASASARRPDRPERDRSASDPADGPDRPPGVGARGGSRQRGELGESVGPVALRRLQKDDGRALILYTRDRHA